MEGGVKRFLHKVERYQLLRKEEDYGDVVQGDTDAAVAAVQKKVERTIHSVKSACIHLTHNTSAPLMLGRMMLCNPPHTALTYSVIRLAVSTL